MRSPTARPAPSGAVPDEPDAASILPVASEIDEHASALVSFDVGVHIRDTCPLEYHVDDAETTFYFGEIGTTATIDFADQALLAVADVAAEAVGALLSERALTPPVVDPRPTAEPENALAPHPAIRIDTSVTVADCCPMNFQVDGQSVQIVVLDTTTLCLTFQDRALLEFALLTSLITTTNSRKKRHDGP